MSLSKECDVYLPLMSRITDTVQLNAFSIITINEDTNSMAIK